MTVIYKYPILITDLQTITLPSGATFVKVGLDPQGQICLWAIVDPELPVTREYIHIRGTGQPLTDLPTRYLGSFNDGPFVWHVFQQIL
jgi:hypothetical protein